MKTRELDYDLPAELIAQHPVARRDESRLLVYDRVSERVHHLRFAELPDVLGEALTVVNDTRVVPARIPLERPRGEVLLLERVDGTGLWEGLARPTRRLRPGQQYGPVELLEHLGEGRWRLRLPREPAGQRPPPRGPRGAAPPPPVHPRAARRSRAVPDGLRSRGRFRGRTDGRPPFHGGPP